MKEKLTKQVKKGKNYLKRVKEEHLIKKYFTDNTLLNLCFSMRDKFYYA